MTTSVGFIGFGNMVNLTEAGERVRPILNAIGTNIYHLGPVGSGNTLLHGHRAPRRCDASRCALMRFA